ncbi:MAG: DUF3750 domain-containing protein [Patescibacteria group bacterium]|nr:DUF3750 domain-containing protein [Patescibacteria group bacterium]
MTREDTYSALVRKESTQVFLFTSPTNLPFSFASHPWFVINTHGVLSRWEVLFRKTDWKTSWGHLHKDFFRPFQGIEVFPYIEGLFWNAKLLKEVEGDVALRMAEYIESSPDMYPYNTRYFLTGPNSNTYTQWVLNHFPELDVTLPWNSFGKGYAIKNSITS